MDIPPEVTQAAPGAVGSAVALKWFPGSWRAKAIAWVSGTALAYYGGPFAAFWFDLTDARAVSACGFAVGLFGLLLADKGYELVREFNLVEFVRKKLGG